jgi:hypothetical protein
MPCIGVFFGIKFYVYAGDHGVPHVHVVHGDEEATLEIATGRVIAGRLRAATREHARAWLETNRENARAAWVRMNGSK